uniref:phosphodiester glycosidase family protein n=1 Tax=Calothrix sp. PCC 6303 TaxID=1170562 RepID=UPI001EF12D05|nr:phosphodiester glycosidase family protein [Calothrix sp. PCC 6303]
MNSQWNRAFASENYTTISQSLPTPNKPPATSGNQIILNGRTVTGFWRQQPRSKNQVTTYIADGTLQQLVGVELLDTNNPSKQPIRWFSPTNKPQILTARLISNYRYLDVTNLSKTSGWQIQVQGNILTISTPTAKITDIRETNLLATPPIQLVGIDLDVPVPWQIRQEPPVKKVVDADAVNPQPTAPPNREWTIILDGIADQRLVERYTPIIPIPTPTAPIPLPNLLKQLPTPEPTPIAPAAESAVKQVQVVNNQTLIRISVPFGYAPRISSASNNSRYLSVEIRPDALLGKTITWAPGIKWQQQWLSLGKDSFPVVRLEINPRLGVKLKPIVSNPDTLIGTAALIQTAPKYEAAGAINAGFFNRNNRLPLGAIRSQGTWLSSPILNRGAIAWNDFGQFYVGRLALEETLTIIDNPGSGKIPISFLNSGYVQSSIARYTAAWGKDYTPLTDTEIILIVENNQVTNQIPVTSTTKNPVPIPPQGSLLVFRGNTTTSANLLPIGTKINIQSRTIPDEFNRYPNIIGAGPLLIQNNQIVLDAKLENFSNAFIREKAIRSGICTDAKGLISLVTIHNRSGGAGPTLAEHAQLMQQLGCTNALNLDGGSSTSLYLGGQLIDRSPSTAARVHNGIGIFRSK